MTQLKLKEINRAKEEVEIERNMLAGKKTTFMVHGIMLKLKMICRETNGGTERYAYPHEA